MMQPVAMRPLSYRPGWSSAPCLYRYLIISLSQKSLVSHHFFSFYKIISAGQVDNLFPFFLFFLFILLLPREQVLLAELGGVPPLNFFLSAPPHLSRHI